MRHARQSYCLVERSSEILSCVSGCAAFEAPISLVALMRGSQGCSSGTQPCSRYGQSRIRRKQSEAGQGASPCSSLDRNSSAGTRVHFTCDAVLVAGSRLILATCFGLFGQCWRSGHAGILNKNAADETRPCLDLQEFCCDVRSPLPNSALLNGALFYWCGAFRGHSGMPSTWLMHA